jgi:tRNA A37 methylthiotransferase MiaB
LLAVQQQVSHELNRQMVEQVVEVLVEGESKLVSRQAGSTGGNGGAVELGWLKRNQSAIEQSPTLTQMVGRTRGDQVVVFDGDLSLKGQILELEIVNSQSLTLFGRHVEQTVAVAG